MVQSPHKVGLRIAACRLRPHISGQVSISEVVHRRRCVNGNVKCKGKVREGTFRGCRKP